MSSRSRESAGSRTDPQSNSPPTELTDEQWSLIADLFPEQPPGRQGGRPRVNARQCFDGIVWVLRSGARWKDLPGSFPSYPTCWRRFVEWTAAGVWENAWHRLVRLLDERSEIDWEESFADGTFASAKKGVIWSARPNVAREPRSWSSPTVEDCPWPSTSPAPVLLKSL